MNTSEKLNMINAAVLTQNTIALSVQDTPYGREFWAAGRNLASNHRKSFEGHTHKNRDVHLNYEPSYYLIAFGEE
jgi:hypothetical protein